MLRSESVADSLVPILSKYTTVVTFTHAGLSPVKHHLSLEDKLKLLIVVTYPFLQELSSFKVQVPQQPCTTVPSSEYEAEELAAVLNGLNIEHVRMLMWVAFPNPCRNVLCVCLCL